MEKTQKTSSLIDFEVDEKVMPKPNITPSKRRFLTSYDGDVVEELSVIPSDYTNLDRDIVVLWSYKQNTLIVMSKVRFKEHVLLVNREAIRKIVGEVSDSISSLKIQRYTEISEEKAYDLLRQV